MSVLSTCLNCWCTHPVVDVIDACSKALYRCYSIANSDVDIDLTVVSILMQVHAVPCSKEVLSDITSLGAVVLFDLFIKYNTAILYQCCS